ncbi:hypothetical protein C0J52_25457 [Blattella germanica]|nr:hypothetical protein C0J52_25457 [Blattella germanica]
MLHGHTHAHHSFCFYRHSVVNRAMANIWTPQQKVQCVLWLADEKSVTRVHVRRTWNMDPPGHKEISNGTELSEKQDLYYRKLVNMQNGL